MLAALIHMFHSGLLVNEIFHAAFSVPFAYIAYRKFGKHRYFFYILAFSYLIDLDHLVDYWIYYGFGFDPVRFVALGYFPVKGFAWVPIHAWEWVIALFLTYRYVYKKEIIYVLALGILGHLVWDVLSMQSVNFYSIIYRYSQFLRYFSI